MKESGYNNDNHSGGASGHITLCGFLYICLYGGIITLILTLAGYFPCLEKYIGNL